MPSIKSIPLMEKTTPPPTNGLQSAVIHTRWRQ